MGQPSSDHNGISHAQQRFQHLDVMNKADFLQFTTASYRQVDSWCRHGVPIGMNNNRGSGSRRKFTMLDAQICTFLAELSELAGGYPRQGPILGLLRTVAAGLRERPEWLDAPAVYVSLDGVLSTSPRTGWVLCRGRNAGGPR